jgi:hypothetical protein
MMIPRGYFEICRGRTMVGAAYEAHDTNGRLAGLGARGDAIPVLRTVRS